MEFSDYREWVIRHLGYDPDSSSIRRRYELNVSQMLAQVRGAEFITTLPSIIDDCAARFATKNIKLLTNPSVSISGPEWISKTFESTIDKCFRLNVARNSDFPNSPSQGWIDDKNLYERIDDLVRTTIVAKYLSGAQELVDAIAGAARTKNIPAKYTRRDSEYGYYGFHLYLTLPITLTATDFEPYTSDTQVEIQITTQLQDALYDLTHRFYELRRVASTPDNSDWKWDVSSGRFKAGYAGHALHLIEGMFEELLTEERAHEHRENQ